MGRIIVLVIAFIVFLIAMIMWLITKEPLSDVMIFCIYGGAVTGNCTAMCASYKIYMLEKENKKKEFPDN